MGIGRVGIYQSYYADTIKKAEPEDIGVQTEAQAGQNTAALDTGAADAGRDNRSRTADLENISLNFNTGDTYDYIGKNSSPELLDMDQVISDMKKDSVLEQYRYFVGANEAANEFSEGLSGDGVVIMK